MARYDVGAFASTVRNAATLQPLDLQPGMRLKVIGRNGFHEDGDIGEGRIQKGDIVEVVKLYPHVVLVERLTEHGIGKQRVRECFPLKCARLLLSPVSAH